MLAWLRGKLGATATAAKRRFEAAQINRLTASWLAGSAAIDDELRGDLDALRNRSRDLGKNNEYAAKFFRMVRNNVVGAQGFVLQCAVTDPDGQPDVLANAAIEAAWYRQCRPGNFDVTGKLSGDDFWRTFIAAVARDGEGLIRIVRQPGRGEFGFQLQMLDVARIDTTLNRAATGNSNAIIMGVEVDTYRRPVAYHLIRFPAGSPQSRDRERVPAEDIIHCFMPLEVEQTRGVPWLHAAMKLLRDLGGYREAAVIAARVGASKMGMYVSKDGAAPSHDEVTDKGDFIATAEPGTFDVAPAGYSLETYDPTYPHEQFDAFCKAALRGVASAAGVSYPSLGNDLEGVNFSSIRSGVLEEREEWMVVQSWLISAALVPVFEAWLAWSLLGQLIRLPTGSALPASKFGKFSAHTWQARRWAWVDPLKDIQASVIAIDHLLASPQQIAAQTGRDIVDVLDDIERFKDMLEKRGLSMPAPRSPKSVAKPGVDDEKEEDE